MIIDPGPVVADCYGCSKCGRGGSPYGKQKANREKEEEKRVDKDITRKQGWKVGREQGWKEMSKYHWVRNISEL